MEEIPDGPPPPGEQSPPGGQSSADRASGALRTSLVVCAAACLLLGILGAGLVLMAGASGTSLWPGLSLLALGQVVALAGAVVAGLGLRRVLAGDAPRRVTSRVRAALGRLAAAHVVLLVLGAALWVALRPGTALAVAAAALVSAQVALVLHLLRR